MNKTTDKQCERCAKTTRMSRRFRCLSCRRLVCRRCCTSGGWGASVRYAECFDCQHTRESA